MRDVARGIGLDNRIGTKFLQVGPGFGGSCFPKDALALIKTAQEYDSPLRIVETIVAVNDVRKRAMARKVAAAFGGSVRGKLIAVLGLTFKPNTDDMAMRRRSRSSPRYMTWERRFVRTILPVWSRRRRCLSTSITPTGRMNARRTPTLSSLDGVGAVPCALAAPVVVDLRKVYRAEDMARHGFVYLSIGTATEKPESRGIKFQNGIDAIKMPAYHAA